MTSQCKCIDDDTLHDVINTYMYDHNVNYHE